MKKTYKKKTLIAAAVAAVALMAVGGTIAYNMNSGSITNKFTTGVMSVETYDIVPEHQLTPCDENAKTVYAKNKSNVPVAVRMKFEDYWKIQNSTTLNDHTSDLPLVNGDSVRVASYALQNQNDWTLDNGWYYYKYLLGSDQETSSLMKSISMDCSLNYGGENQCTVENGVRTCTKPNNEYEGSDYHVFVTVEYVEGGKVADVWGKDIRAFTLYDVVATQTKGVDTNMNFAEYDYDQDGVWTFSAKANETYPVHYYRGDITNNWVMWGDSCWRILRTTDKGGVKLLYSGEIYTEMVDGENKQVCKWYTDASINKKQYKFSTISYTRSGDLNSIGYMTAENPYLYQYYQLRSGYSSYDPNYVFSKSISRDGDTYTLDTSEGQSISGLWSEVSEQAIASGYYYVCPSGGLITVCDDPAFLIQGSYGMSGYYYYPIAGYDDIEEIKQQLFVNEVDSNAKSVVDAWFETKGLTRYSNNLEDTVFCNDRTMTYGTLVGNASANSTEIAEFDSLNRNTVVTDGNLHPSLDCPTVRDSFTVSALNGNGKLKYKVGLITADELTLSGINPHFAANQYLIFGNGWTMSPAINDREHTWYWVVNKDTVNSTTRAIRPVVAVKHDTYVVGSGTLTDPYRISW